MDRSYRIEEPHKRILANPKFQQLVRRRSGFAWITLRRHACGLYCGFILLVAFAKDLMADADRHGRHVALGSSSASA